MTTKAAQAFTASIDSDPATIRVLCVEDNRADARLIQLQLEECGGFDVALVDSLQQALAHLSQSPPDVVLLDLCLPDSRGRITFEAVSRAGSNVPIVVLTGIDDEPTALAMVQAGAQDYLVKGNPQPQLLVRSLRYAMERHRLLHDLEAARRRESEQKDRFLSHVSHELRSPLAVSFLYTTNVLDGIVGSVTPEQREHLGVAVDALRAQMRLIDDLLATVRADARLINIEKAPTAIESLIAQTVRSFGGRPDGVAILEEASPNLPLVQADSHRIEQVLTNLIDNALKCTPAGKTVRVRALPAPHDPGFVQVEVVDEGPGIPDALRVRIFDRLFRDDDAAEGRNGLGLGLYLSKLLVTRHGGRIWVESADAGGSRFAFTLPFLAAAPAAGAAGMGDQ